MSQIFHLKYYSFERQLFLRLTFATTVASTWPRYSICCLSRLSPSTNSAEPVMRWKRIAVMLQISTEVRRNFVIFTCSEAHYRHVSYPFHHSLRSSRRLTRGPNRRLCPSREEILRNLQRTRSTRSFDEEHQWSMTSVWPSYYTLAIKEQFFLGKTKESIFQINIYKRIPRMVSLLSSLMLIFPGRRSPCIICNKSSFYGSLVRQYLHSFGFSMVWCGNALFFLTVISNSVVLPTYS